MLLAVVFQAAKESPAFEEAVLAAQDGQDESDAGVTEQAQNGEKPTDWPESFDEGATNPYLYDDHDEPDHDEHEDDDDHHDRDEHNDDDDHHDHAEAAPHPLHKATASVVSSHPQKTNPMASPKLAAKQTRKQSSSAVPKETSKPAVQTPQQTPQKSQSPASNTAPSDTPVLPSTGGMDQDSPVQAVPDTQPTDNLIAQEPQTSFTKKSHTKSRRS